MTVGFLGLALELVILALLSFCRTCIALFWPISSLIEALMCVLRVRTTRTMVAWFKYNRITPNLIRKYTMVYNNYDPLTL